jgi:hypothetical protein
MTIHNTIYPIVEYLTTIIAGPSPVIQVTQCAHVPSSLQLSHTICKGEHTYIHTYIQHAHTHRIHTPHTMHMRTDIPGNAHTHIHAHTHTYTLAPTPYVKAKAATYTVKRHTHTNTHAHTPPVKTIAATHTRMS